MVDNIMLLTIDSLRADHVPLHIDDKSATPTFTSLISKGISFDNAFSTGPGTTCSFPALLTGTLPLSYDGLGPLSADRPKIASRLREVGLSTGGFQTNPFLSRHFNYDVGFDRFEDYQNPFMGLATELFPRGIEINNPKLRKLDETLNLTGLLQTAYQTISGKSRPYVAAEVITDDVLNWLRATDGPFFCWAQYMDVHHPCYPPEDIRREFGLNDVTTAQVSEWYSTALDAPDELTALERAQFKRMYEAAIAYTDQQIGRIVDYLKSTDNWEDTLVVLTSDHGELFGEYGVYGKPVRMYDELLRVPLIVMNGPSYLDEMTHELVSLLDVPPLLHDAIGAAIPTVYEGRLPNPGSTPHREYLMAEHQIEDSVIIGARTNDQLYEYNGPRNEQVFFTVAPETFAPLPEDRGDEQLQTAVVDRLERIDVTVEMSELGDDIEDRLAELGYI